VKNTRENVSSKASVNRTWDWNVEMALVSGHSLYLVYIRNYMISDNGE